MHAVVATKLTEIEEACRRFGVERLDLFGSALGETFDPERSDVDFLVRFSATDPPMHADRYFGLLEELTRLLGRHVDLVEIDAIRNTYFRRSVEATSRNVFAA